MAALEIIALDTATPRLRAPGTGDTYSAPRGIIADAGSLGTTGFYVGGSTANGIYSPNTSQLYLAGGGAVCEVRSSGLGLGTASLSWGTLGAAQDLIVTRDAANTLALRNGTNAQKFNLYNTYTDASNYEVGFVRWEGSVLQIGAGKAGTGAARAVVFATDFTSRWRIATTGHLLAETDNTLDIGTSGATRPRDVYVAGSVRPGNASFAGNGLSFSDWNARISYSGAGEFGLESAANTFCFRRDGAQPMTVRVYNTYTDASNYERGFTRWNSSIFEIGTEAAGTGTNRDLRLLTGAFTHTFSSSDGSFLLSGAARLLSANARVELGEVTAPSAPAANRVVIYAEDNGGGKTRLMARFATGAAQQIAIEP